MEKIYTNDIQPYETEHLSMLRALAPECMVLLKKKGDFPLDAPCKLALYGSGARETIKGGTGSGDVNVRHFVTIEEGLEKAGFTITSGDWMDAYAAARAAEKARFKEAILKEAAEKGKSALLIGMGRIPEEPRYDFPISGEGTTCVYVLARNSGEGADRSGRGGDFALTDDETRDILRCAGQYEKFMLVLNVGGPLDLTPVLDRVENILLLSQLGSVTGDAFADVLLGKAYPSGKLTATWARLEDYPDVGSFGELDDTRYAEGIFVGYRWFEATGKTPLFPFGFGLGYTEFQTTAERFFTENERVCVTVKVVNTGKYPGKETVSLFYSAPDGALKKPLRELGAYSKTRELAPGDEELVTLSLPMENMASWDESKDRWLLERGEYIFYVDREPVGIVCLDADAVSETGSHAGGEPDFTDWLPGVSRKVPQNLPVLKICTVGLGKLRHGGNGASSAALRRPDVSDWSKEKLADVCVGKHSTSQGAAAIIGSSASRVAGAGGETSNTVEEAGYGRLIMADGPAGLRLAKSYYETEAGAEGLDREALGWLMELIPEQYKALILAKLQKNEEAAREKGILYHYASAIPIGTALAQSWNPVLAEQCGDLVGCEMERFGVNVWLAPALNIHRSPLCGRNFEYYSEDPVISGKVAAAITRGVQKHKKCAVTIKHFAANNQETNRYGSNSLVSGRALREIYLKGFEICVRESAPKFIMTSYNLINGIHTANRRDLLMDVLRGEWGFNGVVMTDWGTTNGSFNMGRHQASDPALCLAAGNDLIMSGSPADTEGILDGLETGRLAIEELRSCAMRILALSGELS